eukprot:SAG31_NODE_3837_length_3834_cov_1.902276_4_plen_181_part_00
MLRSCGGCSKWLCVCGRSWGAAQRGSRSDVSAAGCQDLGSGVRLAWEESRQYVTKLLGLLTTPKAAMRCLWEPGILAIFVNLSRVHAWGKPGRDALGSSDLENWGGGGAATSCEDSGSKGCKVVSPLQQHPSRRARRAQGTIIRDACSINKLVSWKSKMESPCAGLRPKVPPLAPTVHDK